MIALDWPWVNGGLERILQTIPSAGGYDGLYGPPKTGTILAAWLSAKTGLPLLTQPTRDSLIVDDIHDSGETLRGLPAKTKAVLIWKGNPEPPDFWHRRVEPGEWVTWPWETARDDRAIVRRMIQRIGDDPAREGLLDTPRRVVRSWDALFCGYQQNPSKCITSFEAPYSDQVVAVKGIRFYSTCEHHLIPFFGEVGIAYLPSKRVLGLSKFARVTDIFARRLQIQERFTMQIAETLETALEPRAILVHSRALHLCMMARGVAQEKAETECSVAHGEARSNPNLKAEMLEALR